MVCALTLGQTQAEEFLDASRSVKASVKSTSSGKGGGVCERIMSELPIIEGCMGAREPHGWHGRREATGSPWV